MTLIFPIDAAIKFNGNRLTDHNRGPIDINPERIAFKKRMANGTLRQFLVADKHSFKVSWEDIPQSSIRAVDGFWALDSLRSFYLSTPHEFTLTLTFGNGNTEEYTVMFDKFSATLTKRSQYRDFWNLNITLDEV